MDYKDLLIKEGVLVSEQKNSLVLPSESNIRYIILLTDKHDIIRGLSLIGSDGLKSRIVKAIIRLTNIFNLTHLFFGKISCSIDSNSRIFNSIRNKYPDTTSINLYVASVKNNNSSITFQVNRGEKVSYVRWPINDSARQMAEVECIGVKKLVENIPEVLAMRYEGKINDMYAYSGIPNYYVTCKFTQSKKTVLKQLCLGGYTKFSNNLTFIEMNKDISDLFVHHKIEGIGNIFNSICGSLSSVKVLRAFYHGDFTSTNVLIDKESKKHILIDFEYSRPEFFIIFDLYHYFYKKKSLHSNDIKDDLISLLEKEIVDTYGKYCYKSEETMSINEFVILSFTYFNFMILRRYILCEGRSYNEKCVINLLGNIKMLSNYE